MTTGATGATDDAGVPKGRFLRRTLRKRCPQCGMGELFRSFARLHERCAECGLAYRREPGSMTGSMYLCTAVTEVFAALLVAAGWILTDWSLPVFLAVSVPVLLLFSYAFLPRSMALWVAFEYMVDVSNGEPWAQPRL